MADVSKETEQKISQLQLIEQNLQNFLVQKQQFQIQLMEIDSALSELEKVERAYKIVGNIMIDSKKEDLKKDLDRRKDMFNMKLKNLEKQEERIKEKAKKLQEEVLSEFKK